MVLHAERDEAAAYRGYRNYVLAVLARRCRWLAPDEREAVFHDAYLVLLEKERRGVLDPSTMPAPKVRAYLVQTAINKALDEGKRAERKRTRSFGDDFPTVAAPEPGPDEQAETSWDGARVRELVAEPPDRQRTIIKLRYFFERTPAEIQEFMGITSRTYRRQLERAMAKVSDRYQLVSSGRLCEDRRGLLRAFVAGTADREQARIAREHLATCPACSTWAAELRTAATRVAALLPMPALLASEGTFGRGIETAEAVRQGVTEAAATAKHHAANLLARMDASSSAYLGGARPGAMAATVASCVALAGGTTTYCVVEGVPDPIRSIVGADEAKGESDGEKPAEENQAPAEPLPDPGALPASQSAAATPAAVDPQAGQEPASSSPTQAAQPRDPAAQEFGFEASAPQPSSTESTPTPAPVAPSPASSQTDAAVTEAPAGEFDP